MTNRALVIVGPDGVVAGRTSPSHPASCPARTSSSTASQRRSAPREARRSSSADARAEVEDRLDVALHEHAVGERAERAEADRVAHRVAHQRARRPAPVERVRVVPQRVGPRTCTSTKRCGGSHCLDRASASATGTPCRRSRYWISVAGAASRSAPGVTTRKRSSGGVIASRLRASAKNGKTSSRRAGEAPARARASWIAHAATGYGDDARCG